MNMIAIGGSIGTGLFVATGSSISTAGPGGSMVAYGVIGLAVYFVMTALGEMATYRPVPEPLRLIRQIMWIPLLDLPWGGTTGTAAP